MGRDKWKKGNLQLTKTVRDISPEKYFVTKVFRIKKLKQSSPMLPDTATNFT